MNSKTNLKKWICILNIAGCTQFIILTAIAMYFYKGGTYIEPSTPGYTFWYNYFSDLGRTIAHSGISNKTSFLLFTPALALWGIMQIPFYVIFPSFFKTSVKLKKNSITGSTLGILAGIFYIGIAFTPSNIANFLHDTFVVLGFFSIFFSIIIYSIVIFKADNYPNIYAIILTISAIILCIYFIFLVFSPHSQTSIGLYINVVGQKFMIYTLLICGIIQGYGALKQLAL